MSGTEVVVVGGGIAGTTIAYELASRGLAVTLLEQDRLGAGASGRNTGTLLHQTGPAVAAMLRASVERYRALPDSFAWTPRSELLLARTPEQLALAAAKAQAIAAQGVRVSAVDGDALRARRARSCAPACGSPPSRAAACSRTPGKSRRTPSWSPSGRGSPTSCACPSGRGAVG